MTDSTSTSLTLTTEQASIPEQLQENESSARLDIITTGDDIYHSNQLHTATLQDIVTIITNPDRKEVYDYIRNRKTKAEQDRLKMGLHYFLMGRFNGKRSNDTMEYMVGMVLDYNDVAEPFHIIQTKMPVLRYVWAAFVSPCGKGIKVIVRFDRLVGDRSAFRMVYYWVQRQIDGYLGMESSYCIDPARATFFSYDGNMYVNPDAWLLRVDDVLAWVRSGDMDYEQARERSSKSSLE